VKKERLEINMGAPIKNLEDFSTEDLTEELARRESLKSLPPTLVEQGGSFDWDPLVSLITKYIKDKQIGQHDRDDFDHWVMEAAVEVIYGSDIWKWWNKHL